MIESNALVLISLYYDFLTIVWFLKLLHIYMKVIYVPF